MQSGHVPWLALLIAMTFGCYGLMRKTATLRRCSVSLETMLLARWLVAPCCTVSAPAAPTAKLARARTHLAVLPAQRPVTAIPAAACSPQASRALPVHHGLLQYITPSILALMGVFLSTANPSPPPRRRFCVHLRRWRCTPPKGCKGGAAAAGQGSGGSVNPRATVTPNNCWRCRVAGSAQPTEG